MLELRVWRVFYHWIESNYQTSIDMNWGWRRWVSDCIVVHYGRNSKMILLDALRSLSIWRRFLKGLNQDTNRGRIIGRSGSEDISPILLLILLGSSPYWKRSALACYRILLLRKNLATPGGRREGGLSNRSRVSDQAMSARTICEVRK